MVPGPIHVFSVAVRCCVWAATRRWFGFAKAGCDLANIACAEVELNAAVRRAHVLFELVSMYPRPRFQDANEEGAGRPPPLRRHGQARSLH